jgi:formylmethanofuran dehydrogenase subunit B
MPTCRTCKRMVHFVKIDGELIATENALISVVPAIVTIDSSGTRVRMADALVQARQLHAALCPQYAEADRKKRIADEQRQFERAQQRATRRNAGL